ncbi:MAG: hypothetical protein JW864_13615 [Spirochaetes bacterium]|nr:hypothetical protein [Spirochaetota bacterium]
MVKKNMTITDHYRLNDMKDKNLSGSKKNGQGEVSNLTEGIRYVSMKNSGEIPTDCVLMNSIISIK